MAYTAIDDPSAHFHIQEYTGNGSTQSITNGANAGDFQPDWVWIKSRTHVSYHNIFDSSRGATKRVFSNDAGAEQTTTASLTSFDSDGFSLGNNNDVNANTETLLAWQWKANGGTKTSFTESGNNPAGTHQANTTAGFSIVTHVGTGAVGTIAHGLSSPPEWILTKGLDDGHAWITAHKSIGFDNNTLFNTTDAFASDSTYNNTDPTSSVFTVKNQGGVNKDGENYVNYLFHSVQGYSKIGTYKGTSNADGPFVHLGFKPAWIILKRSSSTGNWLLYNNKMDVDNEALTYLVSNETDAQSTAANGIDLLSNGFKLRRTGVSWNNSGDTYVYIAFAEHPLVSSKGVPVTAR